MQRMTLNELAAKCGISRSQAHKLAYKHAKAKKEYRETNGGVMEVVTVPAGWAQQQVDRYATARQRASVAS